MNCSSHSFSLRVVFQNESSLITKKLEHNKVIFWLKMHVCKVKADVPSLSLFWLLSYGLSQTWTQFSLHCSIMSIISMAVTACVVFGLCVHSLTPVSLTGCHLTTCPFSSGLAHTLVTPCHSLMWLCMHAFPLRPHSGFLVLPGNRAIKTISMHI